MRSTSPLRYPGGKQVLTNVLAHLVRLNGLQDGTYAEPYAGGAGAALGLLFREQVSRIAINDADPCIYAMWHSVLNDTDQFIERITRATTSVKAWRRHRNIYLSPDGHSTLDVGFSTFFLNRCNRSGIIASGGPIGGLNQTGKWKIDARFTRKALKERVRRIAEYKDRISLTNLDALVFLDRLSSENTASKTLVYLDPPYYQKGRELYLNFYNDRDHRLLAARLKGNTPFSWVLTYDNVPEIQSLYQGMRQTLFDLDYSARTRRVGRELFVMKSTLNFPSTWSRRIPASCLTLKPQTLTAA